MPVFTGIIEEVGAVTAIDRSDGGCRLRLEAPMVSEGLATGASVAVNGTCLTAVSVDGSGFLLEMVPETLQRTNLGALVVGAHVNLERAMRADGRFDGHIVQGHVDGVGTVRAVVPEGDGARIAIEVPEDLLRYVVEKGSITVDGVSLTVAALGDDSIEIALIPHTLEVTTLGDHRPDDRVNLEVDVLAKYLERLAARR
jgi:riboflavin synthase